jgi:hypothetical protein
MAAPAVGVDAPEGLGVADVLEDVELVTVSVTVVFSTVVDDVEQPDRTSAATPTPARIAAIRMMVPHIGPDADGRILRL